MTAANLPLVADAFAHDDAHDCFLTSTPAIRRFALAGKATFTAASLSSGRRFTFKVTAKRGVEGLWYVSARVGEAFAYIGAIRQGNRRLFFNAARNAPLGADSYLAACWNFIFDSLLVYGDALPDDVRVWHSGACGRCGIELTSEYRFVGYGPTCCVHLGIDPADELGRLAPNDAITAIRAAWFEGNRTLARKAARKSKHPIVQEYLAGLEGADA